MGQLVHFGLSVIDGVALRELAQLREMNHGLVFWNVVHQGFAGFDQDRRALRTEGLPVFDGPARSRAPPDRPSGLAPQRVAGRHSRGERRCRNRSAALRARLRSRVGACYLRRPGSAPLRPRRRAHLAHGGRWPGHQRHRARQRRHAADGPELCAGRARAVELHRRRADHHAARFVELRCGVSPGRCRAAGL
ncbi:MAG: DUF45 domain-containing protein [Ideonella sp.]|nr:DUF45 domain-containing protein [Ideonella sp.]